MYIIYRHTNKVNGKAYIGYTSKTIEKRWRGHLKGSKSKNKSVYHSKFSKALRKYNLDDWKHEILNQVDSIDEARYLEIKYIQEFDTFNSGYNSTTGGDGFGSPSLETRQKISKTLSGRKRKPLSEETKRKISLASSGKIMSETARRKMSIAATGRIPWNKGLKLKGETND
jgi:group I intron endonuclease